ncbi:polysaccharide biosynthesis/export family protein [Pontixanthobacter aquaemixtae]|uniref:Polysaccharide export protein n=1 Tax=Pontixanthobacter aquaemixtae TaxID=1958940 RepID=A0A844ZVS3_9SPHN|nr:polysaccharide biosynthesis/export family protein [Pontixanthobacter aquaemixtae]MXO90857.1 polysaccharide export protein [Pontixanthobacter aquaemixtae]
MLAGCSSFGAAGPSSRAINDAGGQTYAAADIAIINLDNNTTRRIADYAQSKNFSEVFGERAVAASLIERGDIVGVTLWEAPPAVLFGVGGPSRAAEGAALAQSAAIPEQRVEEDGTIAIPFVGNVRAAGRTTSQLQRDIVARLRGRAHDPQALVRLIDNQASNVTILGEVANTRRVPLTARGERLLDILAAAGGPTEDVDKTTIRLTRGDQAATMPLDAIILDPAQNITLRSNDVLTVLHQPYSFIALGAVTRNAEVPFEGAGLTLAQALGRIGGLRDDRADIRGVFVFRLEDPAALDPALTANARQTLEGKVPVIYRVDLSQGAGFFAAQDFAIRDGDLLYVSSAPGADLQKFLSTLSNVGLSTIAIGNSL